MKNNRTMKDFYIACFEPYKQLIIDNWKSIDFSFKIDALVRDILKTDLFSVYERFIISQYYSGSETKDIADELKLTVKQVDNKRINVIQKMRRINNCQCVLDYLKSFKKESE